MSTGAQFSHGTHKQIGLLAPWIREDARTSARRARSERVIRNALRADGSAAGDGIVAVSRDRDGLACEHPRVLTTSRGTPRVTTRSRHRTRCPRFADVPVLELSMLSVRAARLTGQAETND